MEQAFTDLKKFEKNMKRQLQQNVCGLKVCPKKFITLNKRLVIRIVVLIVFGLITKLNQPYFIVIVLVIKINKIRSVIIVSAELINVFLWFKV